MYVHSKAMFVGVWGLMLVLICYISAAFSKRIFPVVCQQPPPPPSVSSLETERVEGGEG